MGSNEIFALRKQGRSAQALEMARAEHPSNADDLWFQRAYGWALYDHVKKLVDAYEEKQLSASGLDAQLTPYMREFARMATALRGDAVFSQMLRLAGKVAKDWRDFLAFARWAGIDSFSEDDKKPFVNPAGKTIDSLQRRFIRAVCREAVVVAFAVLSFGAVRARCPTATLLLPVASWAARNPTETLLRPVASLAWDCTPIPMLHCPVVRFACTEPPSAALYKASLPREPVSAVWPMRHSPASDRPEYQSRAQAPPSPVVGTRQAR